MASKTIGDAISEARILLQDTRTSPQRYLDSELIENFNNAIYEVRRVRPDMHLGTYTDVAPRYGTGDFTTPFPIAIETFTPVMEYVAGLAELRDDEFTQDGRAAALLTQLRTKLLRSF